MSATDTRLDWTVAASEPLHGTVRVPGDKSISHRALMFGALAEKNINIKVITTSEIKISVLIDRKYMELAVQALHDSFGLEKAG